VIQKQTLATTTTTTTTNSDAERDFQNLELAKISSNLSLLSFKQNNYEEALTHASKEIILDPKCTWSKLDCRRAVALEALHRYEDARLAIFKAVTKGSEEIKNGTLNKKSLREYQIIQARIEDAIKSSCSDPIVFINPLLMQNPMKINDNDPNKLLMSN